VKDPVSTDRVVIVGAGLGALYAALDLAPYPVVMISPEELGYGASSAWAQGGVAAAMAETDSPEAHARDTIAAGAGTVTEDIARMVTAHSREHILDLTKMGTPFDRDAQGHYVMSREAAHSAARVVRVKGDQAGHQIMETLIHQVAKTPSIQVLEGMMAIRLETTEGRVTGIHVTSSKPSEHGKSALIHGSAFLLAGGGSGGLYALTTNPPRIRGQVIGMAARAGAVVADPEFVQFHPTAIDMNEDPAPLATEALRGEGAILINADGERFMKDVHPDAELAPRDIVARAIFAQTRAGKRPMLDTRKALGKDVLTRFPAVAEACARGGIDPVKEPIPVAAAAHYHMGGIDTKQDGRTSLKSLWACGEVTSTGLHGANRLASNGLLEALVYARNCAVDIKRQLGPPAEAEPVDVQLTGTTHAFDEEAVQRLRQAMTAHVGVVRNARGLQEALRTIAELEAAHSNCATFQNMTATATLIAAAALVREESRGSHYRDDFPAERPEFAKRTRITLKEALDVRSACSEVPAR
jgi:L-aspartate oxidase